jgi:ferredoxin
MMGAAASSLDIPLTKGTSGVVAFTESEAERTHRHVFPCIRCGYCLDACPMFLNPAELGLLARNEEYERMADERNLMDCFECGSCSFVCPRTSRSCSSSASPSDGAQAEGRRMSRLAKTLEIRTSPHITSGYDADTIMFNVVVALGAGDPLRGLRLRLGGALGLATAVASCLAAEWAACRWAAGRRRSATGRRW